MGAVFTRIAVLGDASPELPIGSCGAAWRVFALVFPCVFRGCPGHMHMCMHMLVRSTRRSLTLSFHTHTHTLPARLGRISKSFTAPMLPSTHHLLLLTTFSSVRQKRLPPCQPRDPRTACNRRRTRPTGADSRRMCGCLPDTASRVAAAIIKRPRSPPLPRRPLPRPPPPSSPPPRSPTPRAPTPRPLPSGWHAPRTRRLLPRRWQGCRAGRAPRAPAARRCRAQRRGWCSRRL